MFSTSPSRRIAVARALRACGVVLLGTIALCAQAATAPVAPASLRQAFAGAWQSHPSAKAADATLAAARARADAASLPLYNPEIELASEHSGTDRTRTVGVRLELDVGGKRSSRAAVADARVAEEVLRARVTRSEFAARWLAGWASWRSANERLRIGQQRDDLMARFAVLAQKQFAAGDISSLERDLALLARDEAQAELAALQSEVAEADEALRQVGGVPDAGIPATLSELPEPAPFDAMALAASPEWRLADARARVAEQAVTVAERDRRPDPSLSLAAGRIDQGGLSGNVVRASVSMPLYVRNSYRSEVDAAHAEADAAAAEADRTRLELSARARRAIASYAAVRQAWTRWHASPATSTEHRAELLERLWRAGELSTADYLQQLKQSLDTALAGAELEGRLWRSAADDLAATGQLEHWLGLDATTGDTSR
ncbi:MAG: TolC family protein [Proteobacteria bacterium]|nr:TolC family protein [Pseudomonadota bacterium]MBS0598856.1 TolC family protein [Pseudomonadota bacterium]